MKIEIEVEKHIFKPEEFGDDWCEICQQNFRHEIHLRKEVGYMGNINGLGADPDVI